ncbi:hypothetical protein AB837_00234 [bacterium AB1]|nr:hypothetical protein AB837_00234 [bacterium AB1]
MCAYFFKNKKKLTNNNNSNKNNANEHSKEQEDSKTEISLFANIITPQKLLQIINTNKNALTNKTKIKKNNKHQNTYKFNIKIQSNQFTEIYSFVEHNIQDADIIFFHKLFSNLFKILNIDINAIENNTNRKIVLTNYIICLINFIYNKNKNKNNLLLNIL